MSNDPFIGARVADRYTIRDLAYDEALGRVYVARDEQLGRLVHVKVLAPEFAGDTPRFRRFGREITTSFMVSHPHTVEVLDFGDADGQLYLVLEFLRAHPLGRDMARGPMEPLRVAAIGAQIAAAVGAAHQEGIVHRNLCPDTILVLENAVDGDVVKVRDFGMSKLESDDSTHGGLTTANTRLGVAAYTAPEYLHSGEYHLKGDIYGVGAVMWHMLTGRPPFEGDVATILGRAMNESVPKPSTVQGGIPDWLDALVADMLARDPNDRPGAYKVSQRIESGFDGPIPAGRLLPLDAEGVPVAEALPDAPPVNPRLLYGIGIGVLLLAGVVGAAVLVIGVALSILMLQVLA